MYFMSQPRPRGVPRRRWWIRRADVEESRFDPVWADWGPRRPTPEMVAATRRAHWLKTQVFQTPSDNSILRAPSVATQDNRGSCGNLAAAAGIGQERSPGQPTRTHLGEEGSWMHQVVTCQYGIAGLHPPRSGQVPVTEALVSPTPLCALSGYWRRRPSERH